MRHLLAIAALAQFTDATGTCMLLGEDAYFILLTRERFKSFSNAPLVDPRKETNVLLALSVDSKAEVARR